MKSLEWIGPEKPAKRMPFDAEAWAACGNNLNGDEVSLSESMDSLHHEKHAKFRRWQDACVMNMIFGDNYVTTPEIPKGYEEYAKWWRGNELKAYK